MNERITITLTDDQMKALKAIEVKTRYEALDKVAEVLGAKTAPKRTWASSRKTIIIDSETIADISFSKGKVKQVEFYSVGKNFKFYNPIDVKNYKGDK